MYKNDKLQNGRIFSFDISCLFDLENGGNGFHRNVGEFITKYEISLTSLVTTATNSNTTPLRRMGERSYCSSVVYIRTKFHIPNPNGLLINVIKTKTIYRSYKAAILFTGPHNLCILLPVPSSHYIRTAYSSNLKTEALNSFETSISFYLTTRRRLPEDSDLLKTLYFIFLCLFPLV